MILALLLVDSALLGVADLMFLGYYVGDFVAGPRGGVLQAVPLPIGAVVAALTMPWLVRRAGEQGNGPITAAAPLLVWLATIGVFGLAGPGGDELLLDDVQTTLPLDDWRNIALLAAGILPAVWVLARGRRDVTDG